MTATVNTHQPRTTAPATIWLVAAIALLTVLVIALLVQQNRLRDDVRALQDSVAGDSGGSAYVAEMPDVCRLLGAIAEANDVQLSTVFSADSTIGECQQSAAEGSGS